jgi:hypothetical protein
MGLNNTGWVLLSLGRGLYWSKPLKSMLNGTHIAKENPYHELISISKFRLLHERKKFSFAKSSKVLVPRNLIQRQPLHISLETP